MSKQDATPPQRDLSGRIGQALLAAAMTLPALQTAQADTAPERGIIGFKYLDYRDWQSGQDRISVKAPALMFVLPVAEQWSIDGSLVTDTVSGASPLYYSSNFSRMKDTRHGKNLGVTRYFSRGSVTVGAAYSDESDYQSRSYSVTGSLSSEDKNTTLNLGLGVTNDEINPSNLAVVGAHKNSNELMLGVTQVLSQTDIAQINLTHSRGRGYYDDPYKFLDVRPDRKNQSAVLLRWNHHFRELDGTSRLSYRYYKDNFGIRSHTIAAEYVQPLAYGWTVTPQLRVYSQTAAYFYVDTETPSMPTIPDDWVPGVSIMSEDQRLAAFGARSYGFKLAKQIGRDWLIDLKYEKYEQRNSWAFSKGSHELAPLHAQIFQVGLSYFF